MGFKGFKMTTLKRQLWKGYIYHHNINIRKNKILVVVYFHNDTWYLTLKKIDGTVFNFRLLTFF